MSGGLAIALAKAMPDRVAAAASIHGAWLVADRRLAAPRARCGQAELYFGWCDNDPTAPADTMPVMERRSRRRACATRSTSSPTPCTATPRAGAPRYNRDASELHWERVHSLFRRNLAPS